MRVAVPFDLLQPTTKDAEGDVLRVSETTGCFWRRVWGRKGRGDGRVERCHSICCRRRQEKRGMFYAYLKRLGALSELSGSGRQKMQRGMYNAGCGLRSRLQSCDLLTAEQIRQCIPTEKQLTDAFRQGLMVEGGVRYRQTVVIRSYEVEPDKTATLETILQIKMTRRIIYGAIAGERWWRSTHGLGRQGRPGCEEIGCFEVAS
ncbi:hypothetical protein BHM03_00043532 [Ensete ventricosum]|nr:hypothetical protein BHM03_00043532 [Ensete ventricosum]